MSSRRLSGLKLQANVGCMLPDDIAGGRVTLMVASCVRRFRRMTSLKSPGPDDAVRPGPARPPAPSPRRVGATSASSTVADGRYCFSFCDMSFSDVCRQQHGGG